MVNGMKVGLLFSIPEKPKTDEHNQNVSRLHENHYLHQHDTILSLKLVSHRENLNSFM